MKRTIWASVTVGLAALMTFGCGNVLGNSNLANNGSPIIPVTGGNAPTPTKIWAIDTSGDLFSFFSDNPLTVTAKISPTGTTGNERLIAIDCRPRTGLLYGIGVSGRLYWIEKNTGVCHFVGNGANPAQINADIDFNPVVDRIRQEADAQNVRINPGTGAVTVDANLTINGNPANAVGCAYTNPEEAPSSTQLFVVTGASNRIYLQATPNNGVLTEVAQLPFDIGSNVGFDFGPGNIGYMANQKLSDDFSTFLTFDPASGGSAISTAIGGGKPVKSIAVDLSGPTTTNFVGIDDSGNLARFNSANPATLISSNLITGLAGGDIIAGCDFAPGGTLVNGLHVLTVTVGGDAKLYTVDLTPGVNFAKATLKVDLLTALTDPNTVKYGVEMFSPTQMGITTAFVPAELDFNGEIQHQIQPAPPAPPVPVTTTRLNFVNPASGASLASPGVVTYAAGDRLQANVPDTYIPALGGTNAFLGGDVHSLFGVDVTSQKVTTPGADVNVSPFLEFVSLPGGNTANSIGELAQITTKNCEMDIEPNGNIWFCGQRLVVNSPVAGDNPIPVNVAADNFSTLYRVSPQTGGASTVSRIGGAAPFKHFCILPTLSATLVEAP